MHILEFQVFIEALLKLAVFGQESNGWTHCNDFTAIVCSCYGYRGFMGMTAEQIAKYCEEGDEWTRTDASGAQDAANLGRLVVSTAVDIADGPTDHVNVVVPGKISQSQNLNGPVPRVANVGKRNFYGKHNGFAYPAGTKVSYWICERNPTLAV